MKKERLEVRIEKIDKTLLKRAAKVARISVADFVRLAAIEEAETVLANAGGLK